MSYHIDLKYLHIMSGRLPLFKKKTATLWNCRCIICGDSQKNATKARGFFYRQHGKIFYKCHNCDASETLKDFLTRFDPALAAEYDVEAYKERWEATPLEKVILPTTKRYFKSLWSICTPLNKLLETHEARVYCSGRQIAEDQLHKLYFLPRLKDIANITDRYPNLCGEEPKILLPYWAPTGELVGCTLRDIRGSALRYISVKFEDDATLIFGLDSVDRTKDMYVVEGGFDSLFIPNAIACGGVAFAKLKDIPGTSADQFVLVFDNQPRNKSLTNTMEKFVGKYRMCIWPETVLQKDINEMVSAGIAVHRIISEHTYEGLALEHQFSTWRKS